MSARVTADRMPLIGRVKYSIIPFVSGWLTSNRYNSPSATTSTPAISCVLNTTRVASASACCDGRAASQSGTGYEPTTVVRMAGAAGTVDPPVRARVQVAPGGYPGGRSRACTDIGADWITCPTVVEAVRHVRRPRIGPRHTGDRSAAGPAARGGRGHAGEIRGL